MSEKTCPICGAVFTLTGHHQTYCTKECYEEAALRRHHKKRLASLQPAVCVCCGKTFTPPLTRGARAKLCSDECRKRWAAQEAHRRHVDGYQPVKHKCTCEVCGKEFESRQHAKYCPSEIPGKASACSIKANMIQRASDPERMARHREYGERWKQENQDKQYAYRDKCRTERRTCTACGQEFTTGKYYDKTTCSSACSAYERTGEWPSSKAAWRVCGACGRLYLSRGDGLYEACTRECRWLLQYEGRHSRVPWRTCPECGTRWIDHIGGTEKCLACHPRAVTYLSPTRVRRGGNWISATRRRRLYERDNWTCQLCGEPVDRDDRFGPWAPSLDHIIVRSQGGTDEDDNLRCAHRWCNSVRGDETYYTEADLRVG